MILYHGTNLKSSSYIYECLKEELKNNGQKEKKR